MSSVRTAFAAAGLLFAGLALSTPAEAGVVVAASGPSAKSYPVGRRLGDDERIVLRAGDILTVLDKQGTRVLRGAGSYTLSQKSASGKSGTFAVLTQQRSAQRMRTGAVRGEDAGPITSPNLWYVDVGSTGNLCLPSADDVRLWRPTTEGQASYTVTTASGADTMNVSFGDGDMLSAWDETALPVSDGASFVIAGPGAADNTITFKVLSGISDQPDNLAGELIENGCTAQLDLLSSSLLLDED